MVDIKVEVRPSGRTAGDLAGRNITESLTSRLDDVSDAVVAIAEKLKERLAPALRHEPDSWALDQVSMTFSLDLEAEAGVIVSRLSTTAGFEVELSWSKPAS